MSELLKLHNEISSFIKEKWKFSLKQPIGNLKYKFLDPAAAYDGQLWDWDSFFCAIAEGSRTHNGLKCHFCPSLRYLHREIRPVCPCASALT